MRQWTLSAENELKNKKIGKVDRKTAKHLSTFTEKKTLYFVVSSGDDEKKFKTKQPDARRTRHLTVLALRQSGDLDEFRKTSTNQTDEQQHPNCRRAYTFGNEPRSTAERHTHTYAFSLTSFLQTNDIVDCVDPPPISQSTYTSTRRYRRAEFR